MNYKISQIQRGHLGVDVESTSFARRKNKLYTHDQNVRCYNFAILVYVGHKLDATCSSTRCDFPQNPKISSHPHFKQPQQLALFENSATHLKWTQTSLKRKNVNTVVRRNN